MRSISSEPLPTQADDASPPLQNWYYTLASPRQPPAAGARLRRLALVSLALACYIAALALSVQVFLAGGHWWGVDAQPLKDRPGVWQITWSDNGISKDYNILVGDEILSADGHAPQSADEINRATTLVVLSPGQKTPHTIIWSVPVPGVLLVGWSLFGLISLLLGVFVFLHATDRSLALRFFALWTTMSIAATLTAPVSYGNLFATHLSSFLYVGVMVGLLANTLWFFLQRPPAPLRSASAGDRQPAASAPRQPGKRWLPELLILGGLALETPSMGFLLAKQLEPYQFLGIFAGLWTILMLCFSLVLLLRATFSRQPSAARERARTLLGGMLIGILPVLVLSVIPQVVTGKLLVSATVSALTLLAIPLTFAYAIVRRDFLGLDSLARKTALVLLNVIGLAMGSVILTEVVSPLLPTTTVLLVVAAGAVLALLMLAGARWLTNAWLFPEVRLYRKLIAAGEAAREIGLDPRRLVGQIISEVRLLLPVRNAAVFAPDRRTARLVALPAPDGGAAPGEPAASPPSAKSSVSRHLLNGSGAVLSIDQAVYTRLSRTNRPVRIELRTITKAPGRPGPLWSGYAGGTAPSSDGASAWADHAMQGEWHLLVPLSIEQHLVGILAVGEREDGQGYSETDLRLLQERARYHALALDYLLRYAELQTAYEQRQEVDRLKDQFIMTMQQQLQTPLAQARQVLAGLSQLGPEELIRHAAEVPPWIRRAGQAIEFLDQELHRFVADAEMELRPHQLVIQTVTPFTLAQQAIQKLETWARQKHLLIRNNIPKELCLLADSKALSQVIETLLSNAIRCSQEGRLIELLGGINRFDRQAVAELVVHEWGLGISPQQQYRIFERFTQSEVRGREKLPKCKELVEAMQGEIWVESTGVMGERTAFHMIFPLAPVEAQPAGGYIWRQA